MIEFLKVLTNTNFRNLTELFPLICYHWKVPPKYYDEIYSDLFEELLKKSELFEVIEFKNFSVFRVEGLKNAKEVYDVLDNYFREYWYFETR